MNTKTLFSIKHFVLLTLLTIGLMLTANIHKIQAQTDTNETEYANTTLVPAPLKICNVVGSGVTVGTPFTFTITTPLEGTTGVFTSTRTILAGPAATGPGMQNGNCDFVAGPFTDLNGVRGGALINGNGSFNVGSVATVTETQTGLPFGSTVVVSSSTSPLSSGTFAFAGTISILHTVNEITFVNARAFVGGPLPPPTPDPKPRKRTRFF
jgi:hypothetical protein